MQAVETEKPIQAALALWKTKWHQTQYKNIKKKENPIYKVIIDIKKNSLVYRLPMVSWDIYSVTTTEFRDAHNPFRDYLFEIPGYFTIEFHSKLRQNTPFLILYEYRKLHLPLWSQWLKSYKVKFGKYFYTIISSNIVRS